MPLRLTPVMQQHAAAKRAHPDAIVFFRLGDFYEMFGDDAVLAAPLLELTLTSRNKGKADEVPLAGVPHHAASGYIARLLQRGYKVAICEQMADPSKVKGIVPREVVRVITPGLVTEREHLESSANNFLAAVEVGADSVGVSLFDFSTGELLAAELPDVPAALAELSRARPREILLGFTPEFTDGADVIAAVNALGRAALREDSELGATEAKAALGELEPESQELASPARRAAARALRFARACNPGVELPARRIGRWEPASLLAIDRVAQAHLELVESVSGAREATLLGVLDATNTPMGARLLRRRLLAPLTDVERIRRRLDMVEALVMHSRLREELKTELGQVGDIERLAVRASLRAATPRDLGALRDGLAAARTLAAMLTRISDPGLREALGLARELDAVPDLCELLDRALVARPPVQPKDGEIFKPEFDRELRELSELRKHGTERMIELEGRLKQETGIGTLKVRFTRVFGWYIEVSRGQSSRVPEHYRRKQTVATGERYSTPELDELAERIAHAEELHRERELSLLAELGAEAARQSERVKALASEIGRWDVAASLAETAHRYDYARPTVDASDQIMIRDGRHPVVERLAAQGRFVPNDVDLDLERERLWLITGPNMAGKSTLLRQVALSVILAQMGSFVPARSARIGVVDRVLSRVGASDNLAGGESTFMVEMRETAEILRSATRRSLVILDEIGRGTSTFDGLAIAWAVAEYLDEAICCRALFATHYHELTALADSSAHAANYSVSARELDGDVVFLHRLVAGAASRSYGVAVAKLAGLPETVLARARALLGTLEAGGAAKSSAKSRAKSSASEDQLQLFGVRSAETRGHAELIETIRALDLDRLTGLEALQFLARLKQKL
ncbi:MAG TPA: DNA mismatch repair protein MutS [Polyangiaceae bacterium]|jgi:DNA mismatch repair protein MutS|nr:DNA mismatch repair protein MutS [Polyangiaceae bacterium]